MRKSLPLLLLLVFLANALLAQTSVLTQHNNNTRSGYNDRETKLNTTNVNSRQFGKAFSMAVDDQTYAQPLVMANLLISGGLHNVVYIATVNNSVYAYDGDNGTLYWQKNYTVAGQRPPKNTDMTGACGGFYQDFSGNMGIVGTPVIDSASQTIYFVARSTDNGTSFLQYLHAVNLIDGGERTGSPVKIAATYAGTGDGNVNGFVNFDPQKNNQRQALTLSNGIVYIGFSSHCDWQPYHGWLLGYDAQTLQQKIVYNATPNGYEAGIWQAGGGAAVDNQGNLYEVTGNGSVGYNGDETNTVNRGESALKLTPSGGTLTVSSYFTPSNYQALENSDLDYGSMGAFLVPNSNFYFTGCKDGNLYFLNKDAMGGFNVNINAVQQTIFLGSGKTLRCQPSYFKGTSKEFIYVWSENDPLRALPFNRSTNLLDVNNQVTSSAPGPSGSSGAELSVTSNHGADGTGIVWAAYAANGDANQSVRPGILRAFDANNITNELWNNSQNPARDNAGNFAKFSAPTVANGHVYLPTFSNQIVVYGIVDSTSSGPICNGVNLAAHAPAVSSADENGTLGPNNATDGDGGTRWSSAFSDPQWIYVDLGKIDSICRVNLSWETALGQDFQIQVSDDAQHWSTVATITGNTSYQNYIDVVARGRYVRMYGTARGTPYGYSIYEFQVNGKELSGCQSPGTLGTSTITENSATLTWADNGSPKYMVQYAAGTSTQFTTVTTNTNSVTINGLTCSTNYTWQVKALCSDTSASTYSSQNTFTTQACPNCGLLPTRVFTNDIGNVALAGMACYTGQSSYNVKGSGSDIYGNADQFRYVYKTFAGDGIIQAKVTSQDQTNVWNKAGLMFRSATDSTSMNVFMGITSANGITMQYRLSPGAATVTNDQAGPKAPYFLRLVKHGNNYTGYSSPDSLVWTQWKTIDVNLNTNGPINGGLAVTSHDNTQLSTVQFDQVGFYSIGANDINLALNKPSYGSENDYPDHPWNFGNDGDTTTYWSSLPTSSSVSYEVDLGHPFLLHRMNINWGSRYAVNYTVEVSNDNVTWNQVQSIAGNTVRNNTIPFNFTERFVRINASQSSAATGFDIKEVQLFGDSVNYVKNDIAQGKGVTVSSMAPGSNIGVNAVDGDFTTRWASGTNDPQWIYVALDKIYNITGVSITWEYNSAKNFDVQVSDDGANWTTVKSITDNQLYFNDIPLTTKGAAIRIYCTAKNGPANYSIYDLQVHGTEATPPNNKDTKYSISGFRVYPNPTTGKFSADFTSAIPQDIEIMIVDASGRQLQSLKLSKQYGSYHFAADLTNAASGEYIIALKTARGNVSKKLVKY